MMLEDWQNFFGTEKKSSARDLAWARMLDPFTDPSSVAAVKMETLSLLLRAASSGDMGRSALRSAARLLRRIAQWDTPPHIAQRCDKDGITDAEVLTICRLLAEALDARRYALPATTEDEVLEKLPPVPYDFFISWAHSTVEPYATEVAKELYGDGYATFLSRWFLDPHANAEFAQSELSEAIEQCNCMILVVDRGALDSSWVKWEVSQFLKVRGRVRRLFVIYFDVWNVLWEGPKGVSGRNRFEAIFRKHKPDEERRFLLALQRDPRVFFVKEYANDPHSLDPNHGRAAFQILQCLANEPPEFRTAAYELDEDSRVTSARVDRFRLGCLTLTLLGIVFFLLRHRL